MTDHDTAITKGLERGGDPDKRKKILDGAKEVFFANGFDGASMDAIARAAGVSKGTLYVYFENKDMLFAALIQDMKRDMPEAVFTIFEGENIEDVLLRIARNLVAKMIDPEHVALIRTVIGAVEKFPDLGRALHAAGPKRGSERMAEFIRRQIALGRLVSSEDSQMIARTFIDLTVGGVISRALICGHPGITEEDREKHIRHGIGVFIRAYGPR